MMEVLIKLHALAEEVCAKEKVDLYDLELSGAGKNRVLRVMIDKQGGPTLEDCSNVSNGLSLILDADENLVPGGEYSLEVSSPGVERVLKTPKHFAAVIGQLAKVKLVRVLGEVDASVVRHRKDLTFEAKVLELKAEQVVFELGKGENATVALNEIKRANVVLEMNKGEKTHPPKNRGKHGNR